MFAGALFWWKQSAFKPVEPAGCIPCHVKIGEDDAAQMCGVSGSSVHRHQNKKYGDKGFGVEDILSFCGDEKIDQDDGFGVYQRKRCNNSRKSCRGTYAICAKIIGIISFKLYLPDIKLTIVIVGL